MEAPAAPRVTKLQFSGKVIHVTQVTAAKEAIKLLRQDATRADAAEDEYKTCVGFDMEWQPEEASGQVSPIAYIQVASERVCLVFYMLTLRVMPHALRDLFLDEWVLKVGFQVGPGLKKLKSQYFITPQGVLDVAKMARRLHFKRMHLPVLTVDLLGHQLPRLKDRGDLASRELRPDQLTYLTTEPYATLLVYNELEAIEDEEDRDPYWSVLLAEEANNALKQQPEVKPQAQAPAQQQAQPQQQQQQQQQPKPQQQKQQQQQQNYQARIEELEGLVAALARPHADMLARLTAIENESRVIRASFEQRIAVLEAENRRLAYELAQSARQFTTTTTAPPPAFVQPVPVHLAVPVQQLPASFHVQQQLPPLSPHRQQPQQQQHLQPQRSPRQDQHHQQQQQQQQQPQRAARESLPQDQQQGQQQRGRNQGARRNNNQQREQPQAEQRQATAPAANQGGPAEKPRAKGRRRDEQQTTTATTTTTRHNNPHYESESPNAATAQQQPQHQRSQTQRQAKPRSTEQQQQPQQQQQTGARQGDRPRTQRNNAAPRAQGSGEAQTSQQPAVNQQQQQPRQQQPKQRQDSVETKQPQQQQQQPPQQQAQQQQQQQQQKPQQPQAQQQQHQQQKPAAKAPEPSSNPEQWADMAAAEALPQRAPQKRRAGGKSYSAQRREASSAPSSPNPSKPVAAEPPRSASP